jgi:hypothetical protein
MIVYVDLSSERQGLTSGLRSVGLIAGKIELGKGEKIKQLLKDETRGLPPLSALI